MKKNKFILFALFLFLSANEMIAQSDHLEPAGDIFGTGISRLYHLKVRQVLYDGLTDSPVIRYFILPSFTPESVLEIEYDKKENKFFLVYHIGEKMIWSNDDWADTKVLKYKKSISKEEVDLIKSLFESAVMGAKNQEIPKKINANGLEEHYVHLDGVTYFFFYLEQETGLKSGRVWSPNKGTKMNRLVVIGDQLIELTKSETSTVVLSEELKTDIVNLTKDLEY